MYLDQARARATVEQNDRDTPTIQIGDGVTCPPGEKRTRRGRPPLGQVILGLAGHDPGPEVEHALEL
jgi:hypothetical protein